MFLCKINTWSAKEKANLFYASNKTIGETIVSKVEEIISSVPGGELVADVEADEEYHRPFFGYGESHLQVRLIVRGKVYNLQVLTEDRLKGMIADAVEKKKKEQAAYLLKREKEHAEAEKKNSLIIEKEGNLLRQVASLSGNALVERLRALGWDEKWDMDEQTFRHPECLHPFGYIVPSLLEYVFDYGDYD